MGEQIIFPLYIHMDKCGKMSANKYTLNSCGSRISHWGALRHWGVLTSDTSAFW